MIKSKNTNLILITSFILSLLLITIGLSFAYFSTNITGTEITTTIEASGGVMNIDYEGGENINTPNIFPSNDPFATKTFTLTGKSTTNDNMNYHIILVVEENTFTNNALQYKLASTNTDNNGTVAPSIIQSGIASGAQEIYLGDGTFESPVNNKEHSYTLELYFPDTIEGQNDDMGKTFKAYINIREGNYNFPGYNPEKGVNHPVLFTGMTPIKWNENNEETETTEDDPDWYNYDEKRWANAKSLDGSYWVWIPRYAYKIESGYHSNTTGTIDVKFLKATTNFTDDNTTIESAGYLAHEKDTSMHHFLHPAFQFNSEELGFWMAKFEATAKEGLDSSFDEELCDERDNTFSKTVIISPDTSSWRCINIFNAYKSSLEMKDKSGIYGWLSNEVDTHMMKNVEWGAVAYLSKSKYGAHLEEVWNNTNKYFKTGCSGTSVSASINTECIKYNTQNGAKASTSYNIYGVYDMSGGAGEKVMANYNNLATFSGFSDVDILNTQAIYINRYKTTQNDLFNGEGMDYDNRIYGDAVYEISSDADRFDGSSSIGSSNGSWFSDYSFLPRVSNPWYVRGGDNTSKSHAGLFAFGRESGIGYWTGTFRPVLMPLK